jgi:hypothetical protein
LAASTATAATAISTLTPTPTSSTPTATPVAQTVLDFFTAALHNNGNAVLITWRTSAEANTLGFYIYRAETTARTEFVPLTGLIPGVGVQGGDYQYVDDTVVVNNEYTYLLVEKKQDGSLVEFENEEEPIGIGDPELRNQLWLPLVLR